MLVIEKELDCGEFLLKHVETEIHITVTKKELLWLKENNKIERSSVGSK